jgi:hypothetical protein
MADDDESCAGVPQHFRAEVAGVRAAGHGVTILAAQ